MVVVGLLAARIIVEPGGRLDPTCAVMRASPLRGARPHPGPPVLGFVACGAVARRSAVLECGGFHRRYGVGGLERARDLTAAHRRFAFLVASLGVLASSG